MVSSRPLITLLTDFGLRDAYVGVLKGAILSKSPDVRLVDLTHLIPPQDVLAGAFTLETAWRYFPTGSIHLAVVDPGVGSDRQRVALSARGHYFVGPDNGLLSSALPDHARSAREPDAGYTPRTVLLPDEVIAVSIENSDVIAGDVSATFEGRDVFAPATAYLAEGGSIDNLGPRVEAIATFPAFRAPVTSARLEGLILYVDAFGNLITDIRGDDLVDATVVIAGGRRLEIKRTYAASDSPCAIVSSAGFLEIAAPNGDASKVLGLGTSDHVEVTRR